jgi:hypothetical protein
MTMSTPVRAARSPTTLRVKRWEFRVCSGTATASEGDMRQFRGCKIENFIDAFWGSRRPGTWTRWN